MTKSDALSITLEIALIVCLFGLATRGFGLRQSNQIHQNMVTDG